MAFALTSATAWVDDYDFTADTNKMSAAAQRDAQDSSTFATGLWRAKTACLMDISGHFEGLWSSTVDAEGFSDLGTVDRVVTVSPDGVAGSVAHMFQAAKLQYSAFGSVGDLTPYALDLSGSNTAGVVRGQVAKAKGTVAATGVLGSGLNLGAVSATQFVYAAIHIFTAATTVTIKLQSDDNSGFTSATDVLTIGPLTTTGGTWMARVAGAKTDTWWRLNVTAITGSFVLAAAIGIQ
jgi:hypothetical protein